MNDDDIHDLMDLVSEGRAALAAPAIERVHMALTVVPKLVSALDRVAMYQVEMRQVRLELTLAVGKLREEVRTAQSMHPDVTYHAGHVHQAMRRVTEILDKLDALLYRAGNG